VDQALIIFLHLIAEVHEGFKLAARSLAALFLKERRAETPQRLMDARIANEVG
jgi:hypothetical protein